MCSYGLATQTHVHKHTTPTWYQQEGTWQSTIKETEHWRDWDKVVITWEEAALPFWQMLYPLQVPTGEVMEGEGRLLQNCNVPH